MNGNGARFRFDGAQCSGRKRSPTMNNLSSRNDAFFTSFAVIAADRADVSAAHGAVAILDFANAYCVRLYGDVIPADRRRVFLDAFRARLAERRAAA